MTMKGLDEATQIAAAKALFNEVWTLLDKPDRSEDDCARMVHASHASRYLWEDVGAEEQRARGEWQISRVYATLGRAEPALHHARACLAHVEQGSLGAFDRGFAHEAIARAASVGGDAAMAREHASEAARCAEKVEDAEDRELLLGDLRTLPV